jgi:nucleoside phosphorylase
MIASGTQVMRLAYWRDKLRAEEKILCFETGAAGLVEMGHVKFLFIKGISNYADSHAEGLWEGYAVITASACAKAVLERFRSEMAQAETSLGSTRTFN